MEKPKLVELLLPLNALHLQTCSECRHKVAVPCPPSSVRARIPPGEMVKFEAAPQDYFLPNRLIVEGDIGHLHVADIRIGLYSQFSGFGEIPLSQFTVESGFHSLKVKLHTAQIGQLVSVVVVNRGHSAVEIGMTMIGETIDRTIPEQRDFNLPSEYKRAY